LCLSSLSLSLSFFLNSHTMSLQYRILGVQ
jgi:hypothetical protein